MSTSGFDDQQRLLEHLCEIEEAAEEVLSNKQEIVDLDRKRCQNREALRALSHLNTSEQTEKKCWLAMGNCFFQLPQDKAKNLLQKDQTECDRQINQLRSDIKVKVSNLRDKEGQPELRGFDLRALDTQDVEGIKWKQ